MLIFVFQATHSNSVVQLKATTLLNIPENLSHILGQTVNNKNLDCFSNSIMNTQQQNWYILTTIAFMHNDQNRQN